jgi:hypothetical protein
MAKSSIKKSLVAGAVGLTLSLSLVPPAFAATDRQAWTASRAGIQYLSDNQGVDGSVSGFGGITDWAVIAAAASGQDASAFSHGGATLTDWMQANPLTSAALATDVEKRILAIAAAGEDTTGFGGVDYNALLAGYHNTAQIGDPILLNDDIFGLLAIAATNDEDLEEMAQDALDYLIAHQGADGGFSYTTDTCAFCGTDSNDTAAAIIALQAAEAMGLTSDGLADAQAKALAFLLTTHQTDGGFSYDALSPSDGSSTSWSLMALNSLGASAEAEAGAARDWLLADQNADGGFSFGAFGTVTSDTYTTAHSVIALLGTTWLLEPEPMTEPEEDTPTPPAPTPKPVIKVAHEEKEITPAAATEQTPSEEAQVLSEETATPESEETTKPATDKKDATTKTVKAKSKTNLVLLAVFGLVAVASVWFVLQSKHGKS